MIALLKYLHESPDQVTSDAERLMNINPVGPYCYIRSIFSALGLTLTRRAIFPRQIYLYLSCTALCLSFSNGYLQQQISNCNFPFQQATSVTALPQPLRPQPPGPSAGGSLAIAGQPIRAHWEELDSCTRPRAPLLWMRRWRGRRRGGRGRSTTHLLWPRLDLGEDGGGAPPGGARLRRPPCSSASSCEPMKRRGGNSRCRQTLTHRHVWQHRPLLAAYPSGPC
jgi:hypothetical protein